MRSGQKRGPLRGFAVHAVATLVVGTVVGATSVSAQQVFEATCTMAESSSLRLDTGLIQIPLAPAGEIAVSCSPAACVGDCDGNGSVSIAELIRAVNISLGRLDISVCPAADANDNGAVAINELIRAVNSSLGGCGQDLTCGCSVESFEPLNIFGIGDVCVEPFSPCEARVADCDGNSPLDVDLKADHNIGLCTGAENCESLCDAHCSGLGSGYFRQNSTCEDFCIGGDNDGDSCTLDAQCPNGSCGGPEGGTDGTICECVCARPGLGNPVGGGFSCGLGVALTVELDEDGVCGNVPPSITLAPTCGELTTANASGQLDHAANQNVTIPTEDPPSTLTGEAVSCNDIRAGSVSGATLVGHLAFFGSAVGDILTENVFVCE